MLSIKPPFTRPKNEVKDPTCKTGTWGTQKSSMTRMWGTQQGQFKLSVDGDLGLQEYVAGGVANHDLVGAGDDLPAGAEDVPVGEGAFVQG